jgi:hypothetical protein
MTPEEKKAWLAAVKRSEFIGNLPWREALAYINTPLYGLTEEVCGYQRTKLVFDTENRVRLGYHSPRFKSHPEFGYSFLIESSLYEEMEHQETLPQSKIVGRRSPQVDSIERSHLFVATEALFFIDGKHFKGYVSYQAAPVQYSRFMLYSGRIGIQGEALGPSLDELIQILESLHVLNGKEVE